MHNVTLNLITGTFTEKWDETRGNALFAYECVCSRTTLFVPFGQPCTPAQRAYRSFLLELTRDFLVSAKSWHATITIIK